MLLHVSIIRSSSGSIFWSLLNLQFKKRSVIYFVILIWCCGSVSCVVCELYGVQLRPAVGVLVVLWQRVLCCVWVVRCSVVTGCWCGCCAVASCRVLCVSCTVFSWDRLLVCLLCCGSMSCVVCELYGVHLRPAVDVRRVPYSTSLTLCGTTSAPTAGLNCKVRSQC